MKTRIYRILALMMAVVILIGISIPNLILAADTTYNISYSDDDFDIETDDEYYREYKGFKLSKEYLKVQKGKTATLFAKDTDSDIEWESDNPKVATITQDGVIYAKGIGTANICAYCPELDYYEFCTVDVYIKYSQKNIYKKIMSLKKKYKEGKRWTNKNYYYWKAASCHGYGCYALVGKFSDIAFGKNALIVTHRKYSKIKVGDHVRIGGVHSVLVLKKSANAITVVEGNYCGTIHWGRVISKSYLKKCKFFVDSRYL